MLLAEFNALPAQEAAALVAPCVAIRGWVDAVVGGRPHTDVDAAVAAGEAQAATWSTADVDAALADHPRIGERPVGDGAGAGMSRREQAGVATADAEVRTRIAEGNARYEATFGRIYLVRAAGRSAEELADLLEQRLGNDPATEAAVTAGELADIASLRLRGLLEDAPTTTGDAS